MGLHFLLQGSFPPRDQTQISCITGRFFTALPLGKPHCQMLHRPWIPEMTLLSCEWHFCHTLSFKNFIYLDIFGCAGSLLLHAGFLWLQWAGLVFLIVCRLLVRWRPSWRTDLGAGLQQLQPVGSAVVAYRFRGRLRSCGAWAQLLHNMWNLS